MRPPRALVLSGLALGGLTAFAAQDKSTYHTVRHPEQFAIDWKGFYDKADELTGETRRTFAHKLDLAYGADPKQALDLYLPSGADAAPVFVFLHGGGFREGDRAHYGFIARPFAARGVLTVIASYRLLPHHYPAQVDDTQQLLAWTYRNIRSHGGDPGRIFVGGHSAGAILSALVAVKRDWLATSELPPDLIKGIAPISGPYDLRDARGFVKDFLPDPASRVEASPALNVHTRPPPAVVAYGSPETPFARTSQDFVQTLREKGGRAELLVLEGMQHDATAMAIADANGPLFGAILRMITER